jgi:hypothetical protein
MSTVLCAVETTAQLPELPLPKTVSRNIGRMMTSG